MRTWLARPPRLLRPVVGSLRLTLTGAWLGIVLSACRRMI